MSMVFIILSKKDLKVKRNGVWLNLTVKFNRMSTTNTALEQNTSAPKQETPNQRKIDDQESYIKKLRDELKGIPFPGDNDERATYNQEKETLTLRIKNAQNLLDSMKKKSS